jgi:glycine oxidase
MTAATLKMSEIIVVGGGVVGLSIADELARRGERVMLLESLGANSRRTSWAAAGIIPPAHRLTAFDTYGQLCGYSFELYPHWTDRLKTETDVDPEFDRCGGIQIARSAGELASLNYAVAQWKADGATVELLDDQRLVEWEPALKSAVERQLIKAAYRVPDEAQVRCSRLVDALRSSCQRQGVVIRDDVRVQGLREGHRRVAKGEGGVVLETSQGDVLADRVCLAAGAWVDQVLKSRGLHLDVQPWRGQIILLQTEPGHLRHIINEGPNYLVPRRDGRVLVGATVEEVGYDWSLTSTVDELRDFAIHLIPELANSPIIDHWAGLRPRTNDGYPYLGPIPGLPGAYVAAGHFRAGIVLAPATAQVMADLILGISPAIDMTPFRLDR